MSRQAAEVGLPESEYLTVPEIAKILRRNRKTVYGWIESGGIGEVDGLFVVQGRYLIHWPTFRSRQFKPRVKLRGELPEYSEESQNGMAGNGQNGRLESALSITTASNVASRLGCRQTSRPSPRPGGFARRYSSNSRRELLIMPSDFRTAIG